MELLHFICTGGIDSLLFYLPAIVFNLGIYFHYSVVLKSHSISFDGGARFFGQPLLGEGRSIDGLYAAVLAGFLCGLPSGRFLEPMYLAIGAHAGTLAGSFLKRRCNIQRGKRSIPIDCTDFILGATIVYASKFPMEWSRLWFGLALIGAGHLAVNLVIRPRFDRFVGKRE